MLFSLNRTLKIDLICIEVINYTLNEIDKYSHYCALLEPADLELPQYC